MKKATLAVFAAIGLASTPALAGSRDARHDRHPDHASFRSAEYAAAHHALEQRDDVLQRRTNFRVGAVERQEIAKERRQIRNLQERIEEGRSIDRYTLYQALGGSQHVIYFDSDLS